jgi:hypothetical protein
MYTRVSILLCWSFIIGCDSESRPGPCAHECEKAGACELTAGSCRTVADSHCAGAEACRTEGKCVVCEPGESAAECRQHGLEDDKRRCHAGSSEHCKQSLGCEVWGNCTLLSKGECEPGLDTDCSDSDVCKGFGWCTLKEPGKCWAGTKEGCKQSGVCKDLGWCSVAYSSGGKLCEPADAECDGASKFCHALSDGDCAHAKACVSDGKCTAKNGSCVAQ